LGTPPAAGLTAEDPYVGPRPFERDEAGLFFGRSGETSLVASMVLANPVVLLYAPSGAGKSSLINAGVVPVLEQEHYFEVLPTGRFGGPGAAVDAPGDGLNPFLSPLLAHWQRESGEPAASLADLLARRPHEKAPDGYPRARALIVDQFEELFMLHPDRWEERGAVFEELSRALGEDPLLRIILAIREDYLAQLLSYRRSLPNRLDCRVRLELLSPEAALEAVSEPLIVTGRRFAPGVAERLVADLRRTSIKADGDGRLEFESEYVEPVHLQMTCSAIVSHLPPEVTVITADQVAALGNVDRVLTEFYDEAIAAAAAVVPLDPSELRQRFADTFITTMDTRGTAYRNADLVGSVPAVAVDELERRRVLRAEWRAHARWYELTHDRLIEPVRRSNRADALRSSRLEARRLRKRSSRLVTALIAVSAIAVGLILYAWNPAVLRKLELSTVDTRFTVRGERGPDSRVVLVDIDAASLRALARSGHPRAKIADGLERLVEGRPALIAADIVFGKMRGASAQDDPRLRKAIMRGGRRLVLAFKEFSLVRPEGQSTQVWPTLFMTHRQQQAAHVGLGYGGLPDDPGPVLRRVDYLVRTEGGPKVNSLAFAAAIRVRHDLSNSHPRARRRAWGQQTRDTTWIDYSRSRLPTVSFADVLERRVSPTAFRNKVIVLGSQAQGSDRHRTSVDEDMAGPAVQAEAISTLLQGATLRDAPVLLDIALVVVLALVPAAAAYLRPLPVSLAVVVGAVGAFLVFAQVAFNNGRVVSIVVPLCAVVVGVAATLLTVAARRGIRA
jgi:CHASE2 domain-containing sensor protein